MVSLIATIFLAILYGLIFSFSEQDGETSGNLSRMISEKFVEILNAMNGKNWSVLMMESMADYFENPIRKLAHFCEYAVMGTLLFLIWYPWIGWNKEKDTLNKRNNKRKKRVPALAKIIVPWVFVSAAFDEIHQLFIPGRCGNFWDVLLDTFGGCFGLFTCVLLLKTVKWYNDRKVYINKRKNRNK